MIQNISDGIFILSHRYCPRVGLLGAGVPRGGSKKLFFKHGHVAYQNDWDDEQNKMQVTFLSLLQSGVLGASSKGQVSLNFGYHFNFLYQTLCVFSQIKDRNYIENSFHSVAGIMCQGWDHGC